LARGDVREIADEGVPERCINRIQRFVQHHQDGNYEEVTYIGVPLIDEAAQHLRGEKAFTTKRANRGRDNQSKQV
jgi:hypothetical protein